GGAWASPAGRTRSVGRAYRRPRPWLVASARWTGRTLGDCLLRVDVHGAQHVPHQGAVLLAGNHTSALDGPLLYALSPRPVVILAKSELFRGPLAVILPLLGAIAVHRGMPDRAALRGALLHLEAEGAVGVFPEGTRGAGRFDDVAHGLAYLAVRSGAPVVPIVVRAPTGRHWRRSRPSVQIVFGEPVRVALHGDPRARRTVTLAAEQLRLALVDHLRRTTGESP
ncbi:MAG: 1-acyl-sn-glycerol-3-phosphate acyltransferase, partial [Actinomycetota bacterium]|nr:1-acyl-sn-glycerol-3-phosphate acyltransferase [Actinomycetota bacterium]